MVNRRMARFLLLFIALQLILITKSQRLDFDSSSWAEAAELLMSTMQPEVDKCDKFYQFVCGNYRDADIEGPAETPPDEEENGKKKKEDEVKGDDQKPYYYADQTLQIMIRRNLLSAIGGIDITDKRIPHYQRVVGYFYNNCLNQSSNDTDMVREIYQAVEARLGPFPLFGDQSAEKFDAWLMMGKLMRQAGAGPVKVAIETQENPTSIQDWNTTATAILSILSNPIYALKASGLREVVQGIADILRKSVQPQKLDSLVDRLIALNDDLFNIQEAPEYLSEYPVFMTLSKLNQDYPFMKSYLDGLLDPVVKKGWYATKPEGQVYMDVAWIRLLNAVVKNDTHKPDAWQALAYVYAMGVYMLDLEADSNIDYRCMKYLMRMMPSAAAKLYLNSSGVDITIWRSDIKFMARNIFAAWRLMLNSIDWVDVEDKLKLNEKIDRLTVYPGIPDWLTDDEQVMKHTFFASANKSIYENDLENKRQRLERDSQQLVLGPYNEDPEPDFAINAFYNGKGIRLNFGQVLPPFYKATYPLAVKYGGLGFVIGHELGHAFDARGIQDPASEGKAWLKSSTFDTFKRKKSCLVQQYSQKCFKTTGWCIDGEKSIGDNMADVDGIKAAYLAFKTVSQLIGGDIPIPKMSEYSPDQIFFITATHQWCARNEMPLSLYVADRGEHSPNRPRIEMALKNFPQFAQTFQCPVGSTFAPPQTCTVWGDYSIANTKKKG